MERIDLNEKFVCVCSEDRLFFYLKDPENPGRLTTSYCSIHWDGTGHQFVYFTETFLEVSHLITPGSWFRAGGFWDSFILRLEKCGQWKQRL